MTRRHDRIQITECEDIVDSELPVMASVLSVQPPANGQPRSVDAFTDNNTDVTLISGQDRYKRVSSF